MTKRNGFSLVEALVAMVVLAVGALGVSSMVGHSTLQDSRAYYATKANMILEQFIENATRMQYSRTIYDTMNSSNATYSYDGVNYSRACILTDDTPFKYNKQMNCTIVSENKGMHTAVEVIYVFSPKY